jgi:ABC-type thiamin/hydroxymethylpyrimidine transport system permease subunit
MNMDNINKWLTLAANIGVVFGLVFLGFEVRQNAEATRLEMIQTNRLTRI